MAYYGPKAIDAKGDTVYYTVPESALELGKLWEESNLDSAGNTYTIKYFEKDSLKKQSGALSSSHLNIKTGVK